MHWPRTQKIRSAGSLAVFAHRYRKSDDHGPVIRPFAKRRFPFGVLKAIGRFVTQDVGELATRGTLMPLSNSRVLVVEDDVLIGELIADMITESGGRVVGPFRSNVEALERMGDANGIDVALLDVNLTGETSYPLAEALLATRVPYIFVTSIHRAALPEQFVAAGYLQKPFYQSQLVRALLDCGVSNDR